MDLVKIPFTQYLNGYNSRHFRDFRAASDNLAFVTPDIQVGASRESQSEIDINGHREKHPVYEIQSYDFDRWGVINSRYVYNGRQAGFTQYIALDGVGLKLEQEDMDALRRSIAYAVADGEHDLFLDAERYIDVAEAGQELEEGLLSIKLESVQQTPMSREEAYLVMRIWQNCWQRISALINGTGIDMENNIEMYIPKKFLDPVRACVDVFCNWLSRILPPQVMSMISIAVGATFAEQKWEDSACKILVDGGVAGETDRDYMFCLDNVTDGVPGAVEAPRGWEGSLNRWEKELVDCIAAGKLPVYFALISKAMKEKRCASADEQRTGRHHVAVCADFDLLSRCMAAEIYLSMPADEFSYDEFASANNLVGQIANILMSRYGLIAADVHDLMHDMEHRLVERAAGLGEPLGEYEFKDFAFIYSEVEKSDEALAEKLINILGRQSRFADSGALISKDEEIAGKAKVFFRVLNTEIAEDLDGAKLNREEFERWIDLYKQIENYGDLSAVEALTAELSKCLRFDDGGKTPLRIAEDNDLGNVITGLVRGLITDYADRRLGRLTFAEYHQVLELYTEYEYSARLNDETRAQAALLLVSQFAFGDSDSLPADILSGKELVELWNRCVKAECTGIYNRGGIIEDGDFELWSGRLRYAAIQDDVSEAIITLLSERTPREKIGSYIIKAAEKELVDLEQKLVYRRLEFAGASEGLMDTDDFRWWIGRYSDAQSNAKPFEGDIFDMLSRARLKEKNSDILEIVREDRQWKLLSALVIREAPEVKVLNPERYDKWIAIYNDLQRADSDVEYEALRACEELLSQRINYDTIKRLEEIRDQGGLFWSALETLAENQLQGSGAMKTAEFIAWMRYLREAENEGNPVAEKIREVLTVRCRLRDGGETGVQMAYDVAVNEKCGDTRLLVDLIRTEFAQTVGESGMRNMAHVERWLGLYGYLNNQGDEFADTVAQKLCERCRVEGTFVLDVARAHHAEELEQRLIRAEFEELPESNSIRDTEALKRWLRHYVSVRTIGDDEMEKAIAARICQRPILDGRYVLETVLECGGYELEEAMLECEKNAARAYNAEEFSYRLDRYFSNHYGELYLELLTAKGNRQDNLERFIAYLKDHALGGDCVRAGGDLLERMARDYRQYSVDMINSFREISGMDTVKGILRANQPVLEQLLTQAVQNDMNMADMQCFYVLRDSSAGRMKSLEDRAADELAEALVGCDSEYNAANFNSYFKNGVGDSVAVRLYDGVTSRLNTAKVNATALENAVRLLNETHIPVETAVKTLGEMLNKTSGSVDINVLLDFVVNRDLQIREQMVSVVAGWLRIAEDQPSGNLDAIILFAAKLHGDSLNNVSGELFNGVRACLDNGNSCENVEYKTYERIMQLWGSRSDITGVIYPLLDRCVALTDIRIGYVREQLAKGPLSLSGKYAQLIETRNIIEAGILKDIMHSAESVDELICAMAADKLPWLDEEGFEAVASNEDISGSLAAITERELSRRVDEHRVNGSRTPVLSGLCDMMIQVNELQTLRSIRENISGKLNACISARLQTVFEECVRLFDKQNVGETTNALNRMKGLLNRIGADATQPISPATIDWCENYVNAVVHGAQDTRIVREIHANRCDFAALRLFVKRVYDSYISRESFDEEQIIVLLAAAKVLDMNNVWTRYISMAARMPEGRDTIWIPGMEVSVIMHVVYAYNKLDSIGDDIVSANSLADYCAADDNFAAQQKKQKNRELKAILERGKGDTEERGGLFGLFRRK